MTNFEYYKSTEIYKETYYQLPTIFFSSNKYKNMSDSSKIAYTLLKDRFEYSIRNNWIDSDGNVYFIFTTKELMTLLNCGSEKVSKIKKELESIGLLRQEKGRINTGNGKIRSMPNRLFLGKPEVLPTDVYRKSPNYNYSTVDSKIEPTAKSYYINNSTVNSIFESTPKSSDTNDSTVNSIFEQNLYNNNLDTNRHLIDTEQDQQQDRILLDNFVEIMKDESIATFIPDRVLELIKTFSGSYADAQQTVRTIHNAKNKAQKESGQVIAFEELNHYGVNADVGMYNTLLKAYQKQKTERVENIQNLIFIYVKNWFIEKPIAIKIQLDQESELPKVSTENWLKK